MVYTFEDKKSIMIRIQNLKSQKHLKQIGKIIVDNNVNYSENGNGIFFDIKNLEDSVLDKIVKYLNYTDSRNSEIDSEFYSKIVT